MQASYVEIRNVLKNINLPLTKEEIIQQAIKNGASYQILADLKNSLIGNIPALTIS